MPNKRGVPHPQRKSKTWEMIVRLHDVQGLSFRDIGLKLGISRQRAHAVYHTAKEEEKKRA